MAHLSGTNRAQLLLLPEAVDDYVGPDNPVRFIETIVDGLDLKAAGFVRVAAKDTGRPGFNPADLLSTRTDATVAAVSPVQEEQVLALTLMMPA